MSPPAVHYAVLDESPVCVLETTSCANVVTGDNDDDGGSGVGPAGAGAASSGLAGDSPQPAGDKMIVEDARTYGGDSGLGSSCSSSNKSATPQV